MTVAVAVLHADGGVGAPAPALAHHHRPLGPSRDKTTEIFGLGSPGSVFKDEPRLPSHCRHPTLEGLTRERENPRKHLWEETPMNWTRPRGSTRQLARRLSRSRNRTLATNQHRVKATIAVAVFAVALLLPAKGHTEDVSCRIVMGTDACIGCCNNCCVQLQDAPRTCRAWWYWIFLCLGSPTCVTACLQAAEPSWEICRTNCLTDDQSGLCSCL